MVSSSWKGEQLKATEEYYSTYGVNQGGQTEFCLVVPVINDFLRDAHIEKHIFGSATEVL